MPDRKLLLFAAILGAGIHTASAAEWIGPDAKRLGRYETKQLEQLLEQNRPAPDENTKAVSLFRNEHTSIVLVQVRQKEPLHWHADSDITVFLLRGAGEIRLGKTTRPVKAGDVIHIERGEIHAYINRGSQPAAALVVYSPAPGPEDRVLVKEK